MNLNVVIAQRPDKTIYRDGDKCIKVFSEGYAKADILNEAMNQARVEELGLHIPKILAVTMVEGKWAIVSEFIEGKTLAQLMKEEPEKKDEYLDFFVELQLHVQEQTCTQLKRLQDKMSMKIDQAALDATTRYELDARLDSLPKGSTVPVDVSKVARRVAGQLEPVASGAGVAFRFSLKPDCIIPVTISSSVPSPPLHTISS